MKSAFATIERFALEQARGRAVIVYALAVLSLCLGLAVIGFRITDQTNHDVEPYDQSAYVQMAQKMAGSWYPWYTDGTRNPLFPWLAAKFLDPNDPAFFESGKKLNVLFAACGVAILAVFFLTRMGPLAAFNATALAGLVVLLPLSTFFGAEVLFFVLFLFVCACAMRLLTVNPPWLSALLGVLAGAAYLAKPSATPFLGLFVVCSGVRLILRFFPAGRVPRSWQAPQWSARNLVIGMALFGAISFALIAPRLVHAQRTWGSAFYSLPGFWFWADDWETCVKKYYDCRKVKLAEFPPEEQPTLAGYFRRHTISDAVQRATGGAGMRLTQLFFPEGPWRFSYEKPGKPHRVVLPYRGLYLIGLGLLAVAMAAFARRRWDAVGPAALPLLLAFAMCALYVLAMGWYLPTGPGHRFILTLYIPLLWMIAQGGDQLRVAANSRSANALFFATHAFLAALVVWRLSVLLLAGQFDKVLQAF